MQRLPVAARFALVLGGVAVVVAGVVLLTSGGPGTAARLARVAGILILLGLVGIALGVIGRV